MTVQFKRNVRIICDLEVGENVEIQNLNPNVNGRQQITEIRYEGVYQGETYTGKCESGFMVRITNYDSWIDSGWCHKITE